MADDVKVKFSGDFSDVSKGADSAVKGAGSKLSSWFSEIGSTAAASIGGIFAAGAVFDKLMDKFNEAGEYFKELIHAMHITGASAVELQKLGKVGKMVGVSFEVMGKSLGFFSKYMGNASKDATTHGKVLRELGFGNEKIASGTITATEVLEALAEQLEETGNAYLAAANASAIFGKSGRELMPIIQLGKQQIKETTESTKAYTEAEIQEADAAERAGNKRSSRTGASFKNIWMGIMNTKKQAQLQAADAEEEVLKEHMGKQKALGWEGPDVEKNVRNSLEFRRDLSKRLSGKGLGMEWQEAWVKRFQEKPLTEGVAPPVGFAQTLEVLKEEAKNKKQKDTGPSSNMVMAASTLQQIGGGDIASIFSGTYQEDMLDATKKTADSVTQLKDAVTAPGPAARKLTPANK
jgi:hypothetical protein